MSDVRTLYEADGWVHVPQVVPADRIDALVEAYRQDVLPSSKRFYRQTSDRYEGNRVDEYGHVLNSFLDPHDYRSLPAFRQSVLDVLFAEPLLAAVGAATSSDRVHLMQSMLFDKNAETVPHQDWWYLDSVPNGRLAGAWIALEDIAEEAGRFFLLRGSHHVLLHDDLRSLRHDAWLALVSAHVAANPEAVVAPAMRKGDVIVWNSRTIHGALPTRDQRLSRRSLTAHFLPADLQFGNLFVTKDWVTLTAYGKHAYFANQPEYSVANDARARLKAVLYNSPALMRAARWVQSRIG